MNKKEIIFHNSLDFLASCLDNDIFAFPQETDYMKLPTYFRSPELNQMIFNATASDDHLDLPFDADPFSVIMDSGASSSETPFKEYFITNAYKELRGITESGIDSGLKAFSVGSVNYKIKDDNSMHYDLQIDKVVCLQELPSPLIIPKQLLQQNHSFKNYLQ